MSHASDLAAAGWDLLLNAHGRLSTDGDAITVGPDSGTQTAKDAVWVPETSEPSYENDGKTRVRRGSLLLLASENTTFATTWEAVIDSEAWHVDRISNSAHVLVAEMVRVEELRAGGGNFYRNR